MILLMLAICQPMSAGARAAAVAAGTDFNTADLSAQLMAQMDPDRYLWQAIRACLESSHPPAVPSKAVALAVRGRQLLRQAAAHHDVRNYTRAADALLEASRLAPCHASYYRERARAQLEAIRLGDRTYDATDAAMSLHWYLEADPRASDAPSIRRKIAALTAEAGASSDTRLGWVPVVWAASFDDIAAVRALLSRHTDVNAYDVFYDSGVTALGAAALKGDLAIVRLLVTHGAQINLPTYIGTPVRRQASLELRRHPDLRIFGSGK